MKPNFPVLGSALSAVVAFGTLAFVLWNRPERGTGMRDEAPVLRARIAAAKQKTSRAERIAVAHNPVQRPLNMIETKSTNAVVQTEEKEDDALLDEVVKELMVELDDAVKRRDFKTVLALVDKLRSLNYGSLAKGSAGRGSSSVKRKVLEALAEAGPAGVEQVIDLLGDSDAAIAQEANELLFKALMDLSLGDYRRAEIVSAAAGEMTDRASIQRLYQEMIKLRPTVRYETLLHIGAEGTAEAKELLARQISLLAQNPEITTPEQLKECQADIRDPEMANLFYGPIILKGAK